jgi:hypothetical protein
MCSLVLSCVCDRCCCTKLSSMLIRKTPILGGGGERKVARSTLVDVLYLTPSYIVVPRVNFSLVWHDMFFPFLVYYNSINSNTMLNSNT